MPCLPAGMRKPTGSCSRCSATCPMPSVPGCSPLCAPRWLWAGARPRRRFRPSWARMDPRRSARAKGAIQARRCWQAVHFDQRQFVDAVRRNDALAVRVAVLPARVNRASTDESGSDGDRHCPQGRQRRGGAVAFTVRPVVIEARGMPLALPRPWKTVASSAVRRAAPSKRLRIAPQRLHCRYRGKRRGLRAQHARPEPNGTSPRLRVLPSSGDSPPSGPTSRITERTGPADFRSSDESGASTRRRDSAAGSAMNASRSTMAETPGCGCGRIAQAAWRRCASA